MSNFAIKMETKKTTRLKKIDAFVAKYGRGDKGLTEAQKKARIKKILGSESGKKNPIDKRAPNNKHRITQINIHDNGAIEITGIVINGNENDSKTKSTYSVMCMDDKTSAENEINQYEERILKEVSDRTMAIHKDNGDLDVLFEDPNINTEEDNPLQY